jgi:hypothetical protein
LCGTDCLPDCVIQAGHSSLLYEGNDGVFSVGLGFDRKNPEGFTILVKKHIVKINYYSCSSTEKPSGFSGGQPIALKTKNLNQPLEAVIHFSWLQPTVLMNQRFKVTSDCLKILNIT